MSTPSLEIDDLRGKRAIITGASRGIGRQMAITFASYGVDLVLISRHLSPLAELATELTHNFGIQAIPQALDIKDSDAIHQCVEDARAQLGGPIQILVNNAGYPMDKKRWNTPLHKIPADELSSFFSEVAAVDLGGARSVTHAVLPQMLEAQEGSVVFISSTPALSGYRGTPYTEAKAAILGLMRDLAREYAASGLRFNALAPGNIRTGWYDELSQEEQAAHAHHSPMRRWGEPQEVANAALFLASPMASYINGQTLVVDGGAVIR